MLGLPEWLAQCEPALFRDIYGSQVADVGVDELQVAAKELGLADVDEHAARIRRGIRDDPAQAIGSAKELVETVLKAVLGIHGNGPETKKDIPYLLKEANITLGLDPAGEKGSEPGAVQRRKALGALTNLVNSIAELRNAGFGTGHGLSQRPTLDVATARLAVSAAVTAATFYVEAPCCGARVAPRQTPHVTRHRPRSAPRIRLALLAGGATTELIWRAAYRTNWSVSPEARTVEWVRPLRLRSPD
ncbi:abortive infection family protein [Streptomyces albidoflavus]